ncbi:AraC family transcriptional regulator [Clostridium intestinale]|uniref:AraC family transcriptional regulator n=1 Tax=Clostridium intestinale URNW TaxID=1294142 RepID=U2NJI4_9CLOT|nr:AraC family transcriptional regulator [Clostridium intestinale]ERK29318.1 AraC family transcriptional regulator [Clostridium intestinale URNW]
MDYLHKVQTAIEFIEGNINESLTLKDISQNVYVSPYYFHRLFYLVAHETIGDYIRKRRLSLATTEIANKENKIIDIALNYSYSSHEAFTRAFTSYFGVSPYEFRTTGKINSLLLKEPLRDIYLEHIKEGISIEPRIVKKDAIKLAGIKGKTSLSNNRIPELWNKFIPKINTIQNRNKNTGGYGVCLYNPDTELKYITDDFEYDVLNAVEVESFDNLTEEITTHIIPAQEYVVFTHKGDISNLRLSYSYIYFNWLEKSKYKMSDGNDFEYYDERFNIRNPVDSEMDIYIPIVEKQ